MSALGFDQQPSATNSRARISIQSPHSSSPPIPETSLSGWLSSLRGTKYSLLPTSAPSSGPSSPNMSFTATKNQRRKVFLVSALVVGFILIAAIILPDSSGRIKRVGIKTLQSYGRPSTMEVVAIEPWGRLEGINGEEVEVEHGDMWGWPESMGWRQAEDKGLTDLGEVAESNYRLGIARGAEGIEEYYQRLYDFAVSLPMRLHSPLVSALHARLPPSHPDIIPDYPNAQPFYPSMISHKHIHMTDKTFNPDNKLIRSWQAMNKKDGWQLNFLDDAQAGEWVDSNFKRSDVEWAWKYMHRGVLRADFLRYLLPLVQGGVYSDVDTQPIRPIEQWGQVSVEYLDLTATDGPTWRSALTTHPSVIVAVDVDVHAFRKWEAQWPRALGICQWTLSSAPNHPIFLDAVRRVVNASHVVQDWEEWREGELARLEQEGKKKEANELRGQGKEHAMSVMEWTGPGLFTDSVLSYLLARYDVSWHRLRGLDHPLRIGDVLVLPITAFSPGGQPDFGAKGPDSIQANVLHNFRGSWKGDGA
ncbi:hypothetical protein IAT38_003444 [Cryptococcus sp. DSM 104549]